MTLILNLSNTAAPRLLKLICQRLAWAQWPWKSILIKYDTSRYIFAETVRTFTSGLTDCDSNYTPLIGCTGVLYMPPNPCTPLLRALDVSPCHLCGQGLSLNHDTPPPLPMRALIGSVSWYLIYWPLGSYQTWSVSASKLGVNSIDWLGRLGLSERLTVTMGSHWASHTACVLSADDGGVMLWGIFYRRGLR